MEAPPKVWQKANNDRFLRLGALVTRRKLVLLDLAGLGREIRDLQTEILAIERTAGMAAEVAAQRNPPPLPNGHEPDRAAG